MLYRDKIVNKSKLYLTMLAIGKTKKSQIAIRLNPYTHLLTQISK